MACLYMALDSDEARLALCHAGAVPALLRLYRSFAADDAGLRETLHTVISALLLAAGDTRAALESDTEAAAALAVTSLLAPGVSAPQRLGALELLAKMLSESEAASDGAMGAGAAEALLPLVGAGEGDEEVSEQTCLCLVLLLTQRAGSEAGAEASDAASVKYAPERLVALMSAGLLPRLLAAVAAGKGAKAPAEQALDVVSLSSEENALLVQSARALTQAMVG